MIRFFRIAIVFLVVCLLSGCAMDYGEMVDSSSDLSSSEEGSQPSDYNTIKEKFEEYSEAASKEIDVLTLAPNQKYGFRYKGKYIIVSGGNNPITDYNSVMEYYPDLIVPSQINSYKFYSINIVNKEMPIFQEVGVWDGKNELNQIFEVPILSEQIISVVAIYQNSDHTLQVSGFDQAKSSMKFDKSSYEDLDNGYFLNKNSSGQYLCWEKGDWLFQVLLEDPQNCQELINANISDLFEM
ncbi:hypothetical protein WMO24_00430 [Ruthenibacterium sp. CLA-JM-H11]|uniref:DUF4367 domain-containing protein n=1 Tax=Ruthenibacterium intestinale TaxID=3133163 RepID=A0ABV1GAQ0_9FIRM